MNNLSWFNSEWIIANKEWLFSGIGLSVIGILFSALGFVFILYRMHRQRQQTTLVQHFGNNITINAYDKWLLIGIFVVSVIGLFVGIFRSLPSEKVITQNPSNNAISGPVHTGEGDININYLGMSPDQSQLSSKNLNLRITTAKGIASISHQCHLENENPCPPKVELKRRAIAVAKIHALDAISKQFGISVNALNEVIMGRMETEKVFTKSGKVLYVLDHKEPVISGDEVSIEIRAEVR